MLKYWAIVLLFAFNLNCHTNEIENERIEMRFNIDSTKLANTILDESLKIKFNPPRNWLPLAGTTAEQLFANICKINKFDNEIVVQPSYIFLENETNNLLIVSNITTTNDSIIANSFNSVYRNLLAVKMQGKIQKQGQFSNNQVLFNQYVIQDIGTINFKIFFQIFDKHLIQFDYILSSDYYILSLEAIESSIGTIARL